MLLHASSTKVYNIATEHRSKILLTLVNFEKTHAHAALHIDLLLQFLRGITNRFLVSIPLLSERGRVWCGGGNFLLADRASCNVMVLRKVRLLATDVSSSLAINSTRAQ